MTQTTVDAVLALLRCDGAAADWATLLAEDATFEALGKTLAGREAVARQLGTGRFGHLAWSRLDRSGVVLAGTPREGTGERGLVLTMVGNDDCIARVMQQNMPVPLRPASPMRMDAGLRQRFDGALAGKHPMSIAYVDAEGRPHLSLRGSLHTLDDARLALWVRSASEGLAAAVRLNPHVALLYRNEATRATYQLSGRAYVAEDQTTRDRVFAGLPPIEQQHDFAQLGAAVLIELDRVEGYAGLGPAGQIDPVRLVRSGADRN